MSLGELWPQAGLVFGTHLNGNSTDFSGNNYHGTDTSITYSQAYGKLNQGAYTTSGIINCGSAAALRFERSQPFSVAALLLPSSSFQGLICGNEKAGSAERGWSLYLDSINTLILNLVSTAGSSQYNVGIATPLSTTNWNYLVATYDGSSTANGFTAWLNGVKCTSRTTYLNNLGGTIIGTGNFNIFKRVSDLQFQGKIDELSVWNRILTDKEIRQYWGLISGKLD